MKKHKVYLQELSAEFSEADYSKFYEVVMRRIENGELVPMKSAKNNGRKPALPLCFWEYEKEADHTELYEELKYRYHPRINTFYYREHPECYERDREKLQLLSDYLKDHTELLLVQETMNERSFVRELRSLRKRWLFMKHQSRFLIIPVPSRHRRIF